MRVADARRDHACWVIPCRMDPAAHGSDVRYLEALSTMSPAQRLAKAFELTELTRSLLRAGLRVTHPNASADELHRLYLERLAACYNRNY